MMEVIEEIDFVKEHPKADVSSIDVFRVNGKEFVAIVRILKIIDTIKRNNQKPENYDNPNKDGYIDGFHEAIKQVKREVRKAVKNDEVRKRDF